MNEFGQNPITISHTKDKIQLITIKNKYNEIKMKDSSINTWLTIPKLRKLLTHVEINKIKQSFYGSKLSSIGDRSKVSQLCKGSGIASTSSTLTLKRLKI